MELKNTLKIIGISMLAVLGVGLSCVSGAYGMMMINSYQCASAYSVNENQESVTFSKEELNNCSYSYLSTLLSETILINDTYITYNSDTFSLTDYSAFDDFLYFENLIGNAIRFNDDDNGKFTYENTIFDYGMTIYSSFFAENMQKSATLSASQLNSNHYSYFGGYLENEGTDGVEGSYIIYNNDIYSYDSVVENNDDFEIQYVSNGDLEIRFYHNYGDYSLDKWYLYDTAEGVDLFFTNSITIYSTYIADNLYAPYQPMGLLETIVGLLTGGIVGISGGIGSGVSTLVSDIFIQANALSVFGGILVVFAGVSLAIGLCRWIMNFLTSLGAKK